MSASEYIFHRTRDPVTKRSGILLHMRSTRGGYVYILASKRNGTLYIGVTSNLEERIGQHKNHIFKGFTDKYNISTLVWYESHDTILNAIEREKQLKRYRRSWKISLIEKENQYWEDLSDSF